MNLSDKLAAEKRAFSRRTITFTLTPPTAASALIALCLGFICVFSLGILLGRGYDIEARIPQLEKIMPQPGPTEPPTVIARSENLPAPEKPGDGAAASGQAPAATGQNPSGPATEPPENIRNRVINQGDLAYRESLKHSPPPPRRAVAKEPPKAPKPQASPQEKRPAAKNTKNAKTEKASKPSVKQEKFSYTYQVAAYKNEAMSEKLVARLKKAGLKARTEKSRSNGTVWYKTLVDFRGSPDDVNSLRAKLSSHGLSRLILRSKTPAR